jgi:hypothetical protein
MNKVVYVGELIEFLETLDPRWSIIIAAGTPGETVLWWENMKTGGGHLCLFSQGYRRPNFDAITEPIEWPTNEEVGKPE